MSIGIVIALFVGAFLGVLVMALLAATDDPVRSMDDADLLDLDSLVSREIMRRGL